MDTSSAENLNLLDLPDEILLHIFGFYIQEYDQCDLIDVLSKVCKLFRKLCFDPCLWRTISGSLSIDVLKILSSRGSLSLTKKFHFDCDDVRISEKDTDDIFHGLPQLEIMNFRKVKVVKENYFRTLLKNCPKINQIDFSNINSGSAYSVNQKKFIGDHLSKFLRIRGTNIVSINLSECYIVSLPSLLKAITRCCPNLQEFVLLYSKNLTVVFPLTSFQNLCPKLKVLRLDSDVYFEERSNSRNTNGFNELETFAYYDYTQIGVIDDKLFIRILCSSSKLKFLDLRGCVQIDCGSLLDLHADNLESLCISKWRITHLIVFSDVLSKWRNSLKFLDISRVKLNFIDEVVSCISSLSKLETLNLNGTSVSLSFIRALIIHCTTLKELHLESCHELKRTFKGMYHGKCELQHLLNKIDDES